MKGQRAERGAGVRHDAFGKLHPAVTFGFFVAVIILTVIVQNPWWTAASVAGSAGFLIVLRGRAAGRLLFWMAGAFVALSVLNPLFNPHGSTVLFNYLGGRAYTLEALLFGMETAGMFVAIILWFGSSERVMTTDRFTYLFGGKAPALTLVLTMVLRLVPLYAAKVRQISCARAGVGLSIKTGGVRERVADGAATLSALIAWVLEGALIKADSMRARGYGCGTRTQMATYRFGLRDAVISVVGGVLLALAMGGVMGGWASALYLPSVVLPPLSIAGALSCGAFAGLVALPSIVEGVEELSWRSSISKI